MNDQKLAHALIDKLLDDRAQEARAQSKQEARDSLINLFRSHVIGHDLTASKAASAKVLQDKFPGEWAEAQRQGPLGERRKLSTHKLH